MLRSDNLRSAELSRVEIDWIVRILGRLPSHATNARPQQDAGNADADGSQPGGAIGAGEAPAGLRGIAGEVPRGHALERSLQDGE